jgi:hypothetical protein
MIRDVIRQGMRADIAERALVGLVWAAIWLIGYALS